MKISSFFRDSYVDQASYDNLRKISSVVDGQKNAARKVLHTILEKNIREKIKVSQLGSKVAEFAEYLHANLDKVIVNLGADFAGTNNIPLLQKKGNFGTRFTPEASASRYIHTFGSESFFKLFKKEDTEILRHQYFEGVKIEPVFFVPTLPMLLINGGEGVSSGFAQKILSRNPETIKEYLRGFLRGDTKLPDLVPYFQGFTGMVEQGDNPSQWLIKGVVRKKSTNKVEVTDIPPGIDLKSYLNTLDNLEEKKVISSYKDLSENDNFKFEITFPFRVLQDLGEGEILDRLKLIKKITENYTVIDENNKIVEYSTVGEVIQHYIRVKLEYLEKRKAHLLEKLDMEIRIDYSKILFIKMIVDDELKINKRKKNSIIADLEKVENILPKDGSYDYLLAMNILSLTEERLEKLKRDIKEKKKSLDVLKTKTIETIWEEEI